MNFWGVYFLRRSQDQDSDDNKEAADAESDSNADGNAWSVSMEGLALQAPDQLDTLPLRGALQFTFKPAHAMSTLFRALSTHTKAYSVRLPEADYTLAIKVRGAFYAKRSVDAWGRRTE